MLNEKKIKLMTKLALFEEKEGKENIKLDQYYRIDYIRYQVMKTMVSVTIGYLLILLSIIIYQAEYLLDNITTIHYKTIGIYALFVYLFVLILYSFIIGIISYFNYERSKKKMKRYKKNLKTLRQFYQEENGQK